MAKDADISNLVAHASETQLLQKRSLLISEGIDSRVAKRVITQLLSLEMNTPGEPITIYLNSPGGEVSSGFAIYDTIRFLSSEVRIVCAGLCASIATVILCAAKKNNRISLPNSKFLIHQPLISGQIHGQASDLEITAREILKTREKINKLLAEECGKSIDKIEVDTARDYWMSAAEAKDYGLVTKVIMNVKEMTGK